MRALCEQEVCETVSEVVSELVNPMREAMRENTAVAQLGVRAKVKKDQLAFSSGGCFLR